MTTKRFQVLREGSVCRLTGELLDNVTFEKYADLFEGCETVDLKGIAGISWQKSLDLVAFFEGRGAPVRLDHLSSEVFPVLTLAARSSTVISYDHFEAAEIGPDISPRTTVFRASEVVDAYNSGAALMDRETFPLVSDENLVQLLQCANPNPRMGIKNAWIAENVDHRLFWIDFLQFVDNASTLARLNLKALQQNVTVKITQTEKQIADLRQAFSLTESFTSNAGEGSASELAESCFEKILGSFAAFSAEVQKGLIPLRRILEQDNVQAAEFVAAVKEACSPKKEEIEGALALIEAEGTKLSMAVMALFDKAEFQGTLDELQSKLDPSKLEEFREILAICDFMSEDDIEATGEEAQELLDALEQNMMGLIMELQTFDSSRQIIDYRLKEFQKATELLGEGDPAEADLEKASAEVMSLVASKLVTDPEKGAFDFFFRSYNQDAGQADMASGEINFF